MARRRREAPAVPAPTDIPDRLLRFRGSEWADPGDPIREFLDDAHMRAFRRYREARMAWAQAWAQANGGDWRAGMARLAQEYNARMRGVSGPYHG